jgi:hypothetical protein
VVVVGFQVPGDGVCAGVVAGMLRLVRVVRMRFLIVSGVAVGLFVGFRERGVKASSPSVL